MARAETSTRAPRGSKIVVQAFFAALDDVPAMQQAAVARAAQTMIRDQLKVRKAKAIPARAPAAAAKRTPAKRIPEKRTPAKRNPVTPEAAPARKPGRPRRVAE